MFVIMGANGHVGSAVAKHLLGRREAVTVVTHDAAHGQAWREQGATVAVADVNDVPALRAAFRGGRRAFLLNPPAAVSTDTDAVERAGVAGILAALEGSGLEKVVAESTAGAQAGRRLGDLSVLWELEEGLRRQSIPAAINRAAYYMSNWDALVEVARQTGELPTMLPADRVLPMVAPEDLGRLAVERLVSGLDDVGVRYVEGPARYAPADVASVLSGLLQKPVRAVVTPREQWLEAYRQLGFSAAAAEAYARMTAVSLDQGFDAPEARDALRGRVTLDHYLGRRVAQHQ